MLHDGRGGGGGGSHYRSLSAGSGVHKEQGNAGAVVQAGQCVWARKSSNKQSGFLLLQPVKS